MVRFFFFFLLRGGFKSRPRKEVDRRTNWASPLPLPAPDSIRLKTWDYCFDCVIFIPIFPAGAIYRMGAESEGDWRCLEILHDGLFFVFFLFFWLRMVDRCSIWPGTKEFRCGRAGERSAPR